MGTDFPLLIISFVVVLVPLIFVHELGHFVMAKLVGITVLEFGIGFPPRAMLLFKRGDTEYTLNWLPLGGFVRPLGEDMIGPVAEEKAQKQRREKAPARGVAVSDVSPVRRILFMAAGPLFNVLLAVALFILTGLVGTPIIDHSDITIAGLAWDSPALRAGVRPGDVIRAADGQPFSFATELEEYLVAQAGAPVTLTVERGGDLRDFTLASADDLVSHVVDGGPVRISEVNANSPAEAAGVQSGDLVRAVAPERAWPAASLGIALVGAEAPVVQNLGYTPVYTASDLAGRVRMWTGLPVTFVIEREGALGRLTSATRTDPRRARARPAPRLRPSTPPPSCARRLARRSSTALSAPCPWSGW
ncbi:MAG: site-2 protease family protein [Anaerolineae bacterium]|nr:site-2 protease family protein [Anaerolineae bacterium]